VTTVKRSSFGILAAALACLAATAARAEGVVFRLSGTLYADDKKVKLRAPEGVGCAEDRVVVADTANARLVVYRLSEGGVVSPGNPVKVAEMKYPTRVVLDGSKTAWFLDRKERKIGRISADGAFKGWLVPSDAPGFVPTSFVLGKGGNVFALDGSGRAVLELGADGAVARRLPLPEGQFTDLAVDSAGAIFTIDAVTATVWTAGKGEAAFKALTKSLKESMSFPIQLVSNERGRFYVVDQNGMGVVVLGNDGSYQGRQLTLGWSEGNLYYPSQLCVTGKGLAAIADRGNHRVQLFTTVE
jgi:hypothetical protein